MEALLSNVSLFNSSGVTPVERDNLFTYTWSEEWAQFNEADIIMRIIPV